LGYFDVLVNLLYYPITAYFTKSDLDLSSVTRIFIGFLVRSDIDHVTTLRHTESLVSDKSCRLCFQFL